MRPNSKIYATVAAILSAPAATAVLAAPADQSTATTGATAAGNELQEVIVTANRREQNLQDVPISIQALTGGDLSKLNVSTFDDFVKYLPNVSTGSMGPGQGNIFMRGLSIGVLGTQGQGSVGGFPNVAVYLDDQSAQMPGRNLDIYAADMERVEVLEGPQGTLFGAGAQAGVVRYITNKPKFDVTEASFNAAYGTTAHGDPNSSVDAALNIPLIPDRLAVRAVFYSDNRGGYIDNLPATFSRGSQDIGVVTYFGGHVPPNSLSINNFNIAGNNFNPLTYQGFRLSARLKMNDDWEALLQQSYQNINAQGVFYEMPSGSEGAGLTPSGSPIGGQPLPPLSVNLFNPSYDKDRFENTALTITGKIGPMKLVYAGSYLVRNVDQVQDYTNYARGLYGVYYQCTNVFNQAAGVQCFSPSSVWTDTEHNTHLSQELRVSTPDDWQFRFIGGLFYEDYKLGDDTEWKYRSVPECAPPTAANPNSNVDCFLPIQPWPGSNAQGLRDANTGFFDDMQRHWTQKAIFGSADYDLIPNTLTLTAGTRYFRIYNETHGGDVGSFYCYQYSPTSYFGPCLAPYGTNLTLQNPNNLTASGFRSRANITWHVTQDQLLYATWSQGFRPGGFNRGSSNHLNDANGVFQYSTPKDYVSDDLTNKELGWKTEWFDHRLLFNGAVYQEDWKNVQVGFFCPQCGLGNLTFGANGPSYRVRGVELQLIANLATGFTIQGSAAWNSGEQTNSPALINNNPASPTFGQPITQACTGPYPSTTCHPVQNVYGTPGSPLANSPPFQANLRARYSWSIGPYQAFAQLAGQHQAHSQSATGYVESFEQPDWTTLDAALGIAKDAWLVQLTGTNITDVNKSLFTSSRQFILTEVPMRPRVIEVRVSYNFQEKK
jgi:outer membrane receptor protein involved in Fe transport